MDKFESVLQKSVYTFNGHVCDENKMLKDFERGTLGDLLKNVINIELYKEVCSIYLNMINRVSQLQYLYCVLRFL